MAGREAMQRVAIIGNAGGGKSTLARTLAARCGLPVYEVDRLQWQPGWNHTAPDEIARTHASWLATSAWIIDGWGGWDALTARFEQADTIILVDYPLVVHYWWALKRQIQSLWRTDPAWPPPGCSAWPITWRLCKLIWQIHWSIRPELYRLVARYQRQKRVVHLRSPRALRRFLNTVQPQTGI
jgi:hypothetical protein